MWSMWCQAAMGAMLVVLGASHEFHDQLPDIDDLYQDDNDINTDVLGQIHMPMTSDLVMQKLINALKLQRIADFRVSNRAHLPIDEAVRNIEHIPETNTIKDSVYKRLAEVYGGPAPAHRALNPVRPQQKWKIKKGKSIGSQMICYFKLCAFRTPV